MEREENQLLYQNSLAKASLGIDFVEWEQNLNDLEQKIVILKGKKRNLTVNKKKKLPFKDPRFTIKIAEFHCGNKGT